MKKSLKTADILEALSKYYAAPEWSILTEFQPEPGYSGSTRRADAVVVNCWPSGKFGHAILGFEIKVSRADFLNDVKDPSKFKDTYKHCDKAFYAAPKGMIHWSELPPNTGLFEVGPNGEIFPDDTFVKTMKDVNRRFFAAVARRADDRQMRYKMEGMKKSHRIALDQQKSKVRSELYTIRAAKNLIIRILT